MSIFYTILYISAFSALRAYEVGVTRKGLPASLFAKASPFVVTTALLSEGRSILPDLRSLILLWGGEAIVGIFNDIVAGIFAALVVGGYNLNLRVRVFERIDIHMVARHAVVLTGATLLMSATNNARMVSDSPPVLA